MERDEFTKLSAERWVAALREIVGASPPKSASWDSVPSILRALTPLVETYNHAFWPSRGGNDLGYVEAGNEPSSIILGVSGGTAHLGRPGSLTFELVEQDWAQSFFVIDLHKIEPSGAYHDEDEGDEDEAVLDMPRIDEELVEVSAGCYEPRLVWDRGFVGYDEDGDEEPLPPDARLLTRMLEGRVLIVSKASYWNRDHSTYDGRHNRWSNSTIRGFIEKHVRR